MKILFIGNFLSKTRGSYSVSESIANRLAVGRGITIFMASHAENRFARFIEIFCSTLLKNYSLLHIDVFSGNSFQVARMAASIGKLRRKKVVLTLHGGALHEYFAGREVSFRRLFRNTQVQSPSLFLKNFFEKQHFKVAYCPNPVQLANFPFKRSHVRTHSLLWVRAFSKIYNPHIPVLVLKKIIQEIPDATLTMVGPDHGVRKEVEQLIAKLSLQNHVKLVGSVSNITLHSYYQTHAVYLNTTMYESFGMALVEAASCGVPIVSFSVGEIPFLWQHEENILLCEAGNIEEMSNEVKRILSNRELGNYISVNASRRVRDFSWEFIEPHWLSLVKSNTRSRNAF
jgi:glycosyltransferase involved in cell wall biosynthesis